MQVKAQGRLRHRFWGTYSAVIGLQFDSPTDASAALAVLGDSWKIGEKATQVLVWVGDSEALDKCKQVLGSYGANVDKIDSLAKSIDYGEPFEVTIPVQNKDQLGLF